MPKVDKEKIEEATMEAIEALRPHFEKLVAYGAKKDHVWHDLMHAIDRRRGPKPKSRGIDEFFASERASHARECKAEKHGYEDRNLEIWDQYQQGLEAGEKPVAICQRLANLYKLTPRRISMIARPKIKTMKSNKNT